MGSYDPNQNSQSVDDDLSAALRGMAVEHDNGLSQHPLTPPSATHSDLHAQRPPVYNTTQHQRPPYATFPQPDYSAYYNVPSRGDYPYPYDAYTTPDTMFASPALSAASAAPSVYPGMPAQHHAAPDMRGPQSGLFYDYSGSGRPGSQFYYPQAMLYPTGPGPTSGGQGPHKKRMQVCGTATDCKTRLLTLTIDDAPAPCPVLSCKVDLLTPLALPSRPNTLNDT